MRKKYLLLAFSAIMLLMASCDKPAPAPIKVAGVSLNQTSVKLVEGDQVTLIATVTPSDAANKNVSWTSSDNSIATVDNGKVTAVKVGTATITVITEDGNKTASCTVTVTARTYPVESVTLDKDAVELTEGADITLTATVNPSNATNKNISWTSSDNAIATVENGKVTAVKAGTATITVKTEDGNKTATCAVTVNKKKVDTVEDDGSLNYGPGGGAGDNIDENKDIYDGGSF